MNPKRIRLTGKGIAVRGNDIDTDRIIPARYLRCVTFDGLGEHTFEDDRAQLKEAGQRHSFDDPNYADAEILFVNKNFGCGSSREHAPQSIMRWGKGIKAIVGESFAEIFYGNCKALGIPAVRVGAEAILKLMAANESAPDTQFTLDLESRTLAFDGQQLPVELPDSIRKQLLEGAWDTMAELLGGKDAAAQTAAKLPYWDHWATA
jgi:3-isopropylmalate/(R)-2-methylmalate dehydratase small subunit